MNDHDPYPHWVIRFKTKREDFHPVWVGAPEHPKYSFAAVLVEASKYLEQNASWLESVDEIRHFKSVL